jgi:flavin-dependent dehydrogenase
VDRNLKGDGAFEAGKPTIEVDVAIVGGGPAGSTAGSLLKKYGPSLSVLIVEREQFPRDHVGESQLPGVSKVLQEMGCWEKVEAANFPIKVGATYLWGTSSELWDFDFVPVTEIGDLARPGEFAGKRSRMAFQVDRAIYDSILLEHAEEMGCQVWQNSPARSVRLDGGRIESLELGDGRKIKARFYLDCSGHTGILRRSLGVEAEYPTGLQNVAMWNYWRGADWAEKIAGEGTRVQVISVSNGWLWFIPIGADRTSVGLVTPKDHLKNSKLSVSELYGQALSNSPRISKLLAEASAEGPIQTTKDWSFVAKRMVGPNWMLVGESAGFADPILAAGLTITQGGAREAAFTILEIERGANPDLLMRLYAERQTSVIKTHIRFADYWYSANAQFADLQEHVAQIASDSGLQLSPEKAWAWLAQGGFIDSEDGASQATFSPEAMMAIGQKLSDLPSERKIEGSNVFTVNVDGASKSFTSTYSIGRVIPLQTLERGGKKWPMRYPFDAIYTALSVSPRLADILATFRKTVEKFPPEQRGLEGFRMMLSLETLIRDGWVDAAYDPRQGLMKPYQVNEMIHWHEEGKSLAV